MEDVLSVYSQPAKENEVRLCMDECPCQLLEDVLMPLSMKPGQTKRIDSEYKRKGTCVVFLAYDIDKGIRYTEVKEQRTKKDYAAFIDNLVSEHYKGAKRIKLVQDNLNTHSKGSFYESLSAQRAGELSDLLDFHYTPKHGSWLNMAEIEFSALARQCLNKRIGITNELSRELKAWMNDRNEQNIKIHWSFTVNDARQKLASQYHKVNPNN